MNENDFDLKYCFNLIIIEIIVGVDFITEGQNILRCVANYINRLGLIYHKTGIISSKVRYLHSQAELEKISFKNHQFSNMQLS